VNRRRAEAHAGDDRPPPAMPIVEERSLKSARCPPPAMPPPPDAKDARTKMPPMSMPLFFLPAFRELSPETCPSKEARSQVLSC